MLIEPAPSPYDLRFGLFGTRVRVHPLFWVLAAILGWPSQHDRQPFVHLAVWVISVFVSILLHEFGHIWAGRLFGSEGYIVLYSFGGLAVHSNDVPRRWQRIIVSLAGPLIQIVVIWLPLTLWLRSADLNTLLGLSDHVKDLIVTLLWINLYWPLLNLTPIWPLDGGMVAREVSMWFSPRLGLRWSLIVSAVTAGLLAINSLAAMRGVILLHFVPTGGLYTIILFGLLAVESIQLLNQIGQAQPWQYEEPDDRVPWER